MTFAADTSVPVEKSKAEVDALLARAGASQRLLGVDDEKGEAWVIFRLEQWQIRLAIPLPRPDEIRAQHKSPRRTWEETNRRAWEQTCRTRWRAMLLLVKAKLEAIELGISTVEREFLADIYLPDGRRMGEALSPQIAEAYATGTMPPLLLGGS